MKVVMPNPRDERRDWGVTEEMRSHYARGTVNPFRLSSFNDGYEQGVWPCRASEVLPFDPSLCVL